MSLLSSDKVAMIGIKPASAKVGVTVTFCGGKSQESTRSSARLMAATDAFVACMSIRETASHRQGLRAAPSRADLERYTQR